MSNHCPYKWHQYLTVLKDKTSLTLVDHSLADQSKDEVVNRWEKSMGPTALWQLMPVTGPWWPLKISLIPFLLYRQKISMGSGKYNGLWNSHGRTSECTHLPCLEAEYTGPSSLPTTQLFTSSAGKAIPVTATTLDLL